MSAHAVDCPVPARSRRELWGLAAQTDKSCSKMRSPVDAEQLSRRDNLLSSTQQGFGQGLQAQPNQAWTHSHLCTQRGKVNVRASCLYIGLAHSRPTPDVAITGTLPAGHLMNWGHPWMCQPPPEVLISMAHISRSVLGKRPDLYHIVPSHTASTDTTKQQVTALMLVMAVTTTISPGNPQSISSRIRPQASSISRMPGSPEYSSTADAEYDPRGRPLCRTR